jgi:hypothetical protein
MTIAIHLTSEQPKTGASRRRTATCLAVLGLAVSGLSTEASAAPTITSFKAMAVPIAGFPGTGDMLGAGAVIQGEAKISGTEYDGSPPPLIGVRLYAPAGERLHPQGFATCAPSVLEQSGPALCPKRSIAGPKGFALGTVTFGSERVPETASVQLFFAPGGSLEAFVDGTTPVSLEMLATGHFVSSSPPFGQEFIGNVPLIETVPGAPDASFEEGTISAGAAYRQGNKTISYVTLPSRCPKGGWPVKGELSFLGGATAEASYKMPCPKK